MNFLDKKIFIHKTPHNFFWGLILFILVVSRLKLDYFVNTSSWGAYDYSVLYYKGKDKILIDISNLCLLLSIVYGLIGLGYWYVKDYKLNDEYVQLHVIVNLLLSVLLSIFLIHFDYESYFKDRTYRPDGMDYLDLNFYEVTVSFFIILVLLTWSIFFYNLAISKVRNIKSIIKSGNKKIKQAFIVKPYLTYWGLIPIVLAVTCYFYKIGFRHWLFYTIEPHELELKTGVPFMDNSTHAGILLSITLFAIGFGYWKMRNIMKIKWMSVFQQVIVLSVVLFYLYRSIEYNLMVMNALEMSGVSSEFNIHISNHEKLKTLFFCSLGVVIASQILFVVNYFSDSVLLNEEER